jgi:hypothetical protein
VARRAGPSRIILAFGESPNDTRAPSELKAALRPDLPPVAPRPRPIILRRDAEAAKGRSMADRIAAVVRAETVAHKVVAVLVHRDLDAPEPRDDASLTHESETELRRHLAAAVPGGCAVIPVVCAWEMEAWWFLWPDQVAAHRASWRRLPRQGRRRVDRISEAKEELRRSLRPKGRAHVPDFVEADGPRIATLVRGAGTARTPCGVAIAYQRLIAALDAL